MMSMATSVKSCALSIASQAARRATLHVLSRIRLGSLSIVDHSVTPSQTICFPSLPDTGEGNEDGEKGDAKARLVVVRDSFWLRLAAMGDLGFAEAYMFGDILCTPEDLLAFFRVFLMNRPYLTTIESSPLASFLSIPGKIVSLVSWPITSSLSSLQSVLGLKWNLDALQTSRANIAAHYDLSNAMFEAFLSPDMTYSCGIFEALDEDMLASFTKDIHKEPVSKFSIGLVRSRMQGLSSPVQDAMMDEQSSTSSSASSPSPSPDISSPRTSLSDQCTSLSSYTATELGLDGTGRDAALHESQLRKLEHIVHQLRIPSTSIKPIRILEIGTGWGSLSILVATRYPHVEIDTLTLSALQASRVRSLLHSADPCLDLPRRVRVHEVSYAALKEQSPSWKGRFDRVVSVEMVEAVGKKKGALEGYWDVIDWALKEKDGLGVVMGITIPEGRYERYLRDTDFIQKWIFPGGHLPSLTHLLSSLTTGSEGRLTVDSVSNIGPHYARTLREWRRRFCQAFGYDIESLPSELAQDMNSITKLKESGNKERKEKNARLRMALLEGRPTGEERDEEELDDEAMDVFRRKWIYYFVYCEIGFSTRSLGDHIVTFTREANESFGC